MIERRTWGVWVYVLAGWIGAIVVMTGARLILGPLSTSQVGTAWVLGPTAAAAVAIAWAFLMAALGFRRLDEYQVTASKFAWYWGGTIGIAVSGVAYIFVGMGGLHWLDPVHFHLGRDLLRAFQTGYLVGLGFPVAGFFVASVWWRLAKR